VRSANVSTKTKSELLLRLDEDGIDDDIDDEDDDDEELS
jgi:hypothetical protein